MVSLGIVALPVSIGVAVLKYRVYEIDQIVSRTLAYTIVTGLLIGAYAVSSSRPWSPPTCRCG